MVDTRRFFEEYTKLEQTINTNYTNVGRRGSLMTPVQTTHGRKQMLDELLKEVSVVRVIPKRPLVDERDVDQGLVVRKGEYRIDYRHPENDNLFEATVWVVEGVYFGTVNIVSVFAPPDVVDSNVSQQL